MRTHNAHKSRLRVRSLPWAIAGMLIAIGFFSLHCAKAVAAKADVPVITIHAARFAFTPAEITLKQGQTVELVFIADDVPHGIAIKGLGVDMELPRHKKEKVILTPATAGDFAGACSRFCGSGHENMKFLVHVQP